jgi:hypothetical protein
MLEKHLFLAYDIYSLIREEVYFIMKMLHSLPHIFDDSCSLTIKFVSIVLKSHLNLSVAYEERSY